MYIHIYVHPTRWTSIFISLRQVSVVLPVESTEILCDEVYCQCHQPSSIFEQGSKMFKTPVGWWLVGGLYNLYLYTYIYNYRYQPLYWEFSHLIRGILFLTNGFLKGRFHRVLAGEVAGRTMPWDRGWGSENTEAIGRNDGRNDESSVLCFGNPI